MNPFNQNLFERKLVVSGQVVTINPYTEKRAKALIDIQNEINKFADDNPDVRIDEIVDKRAEWWYRKAMILWSFDKPVKKDFFESEDFESSLLLDTENFFLNYSNYL